MKKVLLLALLAIAVSSKMYAQSGALYIKNNTACDVKVTMYAQAPLTPDICFDMIGNTWTIPAGTSNYVTSWSAFASFPGPGWAVLTNPVTSLDFQWMSVDFTWSGCPASWGCTPAGGSMGNTPGGCTSSSSTWAGGCFVPMVGSWSPAQCPTTLCDVGIDFH